MKRRRQACTSDDSNSREREESQTGGQIRYVRNLHIDGYEEEQHQGTWTGEMRDGVAHGLGVFRHTGSGYTGAIFKGQMEEGHFKGLGKYIWKGDSIPVQEEQVFIGEFVDSQYNGFGKLLFRDGSSWVGNFKESIPSGMGIHTECLDKWYAFKRAGADGIGVKWIPNESIYFGSLDDMNNSNGKGLLYRLSDSDALKKDEVYIGGFKDGQMHDETARVTFKNGYSQKSLFSFGVCANLAYHRKKAVEKSPASIVDAVDSSIGHSAGSGYEAELKGKVSELQAQIRVFKRKQASLEEECQLLKKELGAATAKAHTSARAEEAANFKLKEFREKFRVHLTAKVRGFASPSTGCFVKISSDSTVPAATIVLGKPGYMGYYTLLQVVKDRKCHLPLGLDWWVSVFANISQALEQMHQAGAAHGDLTSDNVLLFSDGSCALQGAIPQEQLSKLSPGVWDREKAAPSWAGYRDPCKAGKLSSAQQMDVFSFGILLLELLAGLPAWIEEDANAIVQQTTLFEQAESCSGHADLFGHLRGVGSECLQFTKELEVEIFTMALWCIEKEPDCRPNFSQLRTRMESLIVGHSMFGTEMQAKDIVSQKELKKKDISLSTWAKEPDLAKHGDLAFRPGKRTILSKLAAALK